MSVVVVVALLAGIWSCSNDVGLPSAYHEGHLPQPADVTSAVDAGAITVTWSVSSETNVSGFVVGFTDSSGTETTRSIEDATAREYAEQELDTTSGTIYLIQVWSFDAVQFFGQRSEVDTLVVE
ncbi:MAG: hypothetical protein VX733_05110 [Candidatus Latescibacterota bacterium]|nr:hypothetical protein [Candidatus Latescibacterota bacterium]